MIDTHAHLDVCAEPAEVLVERAVEAGVSRILAVGTGLESGRHALELAERHEAVFAILGVHPHDADGPDSGRLGELRALLASPRAVAVGETGLDFYRNYAPRHRQLALFEAELALAAELGKPVVIHNRDADDEMARVLADFPGTVVLHCFSSPGLLPDAIARRWYVSFAGNVTYPNAEELREAAVEVSPDRLLVETDSPYLAPQPRRGRPNEPANVVHTLHALAETRGEPPGELESRIDANATAAFALP